MAAGVWLVIIIPAVLAFLFGAWVYYNMVVDVSERDLGHGGIARCIEGCVRLPPTTGQPG